VTEPKIVYTRSSAFHDITVADEGFIRTLSFGGIRQSSMYLDAPFDTDFEYPSYLHTALAVKPDAVRTLAIGLGGGTVVKRMWRDYPEMRIDAVELDPDVVDVARRFFALPDDERIRVIVGDGREFVAESAETYDIVIVDAFEGARVPSQLADDGFMRAVRDRLSPCGAVIYNFMGAVDGAGSEPFRDLHATLSHAWSRVFVFLVDEGVAALGASNIILLATDAPLNADDLRERLASRVDGLVSVPAFHLFGGDLIE
jgi:spermidine synthase